MKLATAILVLACSAFGADQSDPGQAFEWGTTIVGRNAAIESLTNCILLSANSDWSLALRESGELLAWGSNSHGQTNAPGGSDWTNCAAGWYHGIACNNSGDLQEWGEPFLNAIGDWTNLWSDELKAATVIQVGAGDDHSAALGDDGTVYIWGGRALCTNYDQVFTTAQAIACGWYNVLVLFNDGTITNVGQPSQVGQYLMPTNYANPLTNIAHIACSQWASYAIDSNGVLYAWGMPDNYGQYTVPAALDNCVSVSGGRYHTVAARNDGVVFAWGDNGQGQTNIPATLTNALYVSAGRYHSQAIQTTEGAPPMLGTYYVSTEGNDSTGDGSFGAPFRTIQKGVDTATTANDTVSILAGYYGESVTTKADDVRIEAYSQPVQLMALRVNNHTNIIVDGLHFYRHGATNTWGAMIRVEAASHYLTVQNCLFSDTPILIQTNWVFDEADDSITGTGIDWTNAGFQVGSWIYCGGSSLTNNTYANVGYKGQIATIEATNKITMTPGLSTETNASTWAPIFTSVADQYGIQGLEWIASGGDSADYSFVHGNVFSNFYGAAIWYATNASHNMFSNNVVVNNKSRAWIHPYGNNLTVASNFVHDVTNWVFYANESAHHPEGGSQYYDYIQGNIHCTSPEHDVIFVGNWMQNIDQPLAQLSEVPSSTNWAFFGNVWVGYARNFNCGINGTIWASNTFYRCAYDEGFSAALTVGGNGAGSPVSNMWIVNNAFIDCGDHSPTNNDAGFNLVYHAYSGWYSNFVCGPESTGWQGSSQTLSNGINGGNPVVFDIDNPLGVDGLPFTSDDGLRPLPNSPFGTYGIGALTPLSGSAIIAHIDLKAATPGWYDNTGYGFNPAYTNTLPWARTNVARHWMEPEPFGNAPEAVWLYSSNSVSATHSTSNWIGIWSHSWDFGDGGAINTRWPLVDHHWLRSNDFTATLVVMNGSGEKSTNTRTFKILSPTNYADDIFFVATNGNDTTGDGSYAAPWLTVQKASDTVADGDYVGVTQGYYTNEFVDVDRDVALVGNRISFIGLGATIQGFKFRHPYWTVDGFTCVQSNATTGPGIYIFKAADGTQIRHCTFTGFGNALEGAISSCLLEAGYSGTFDNGVDDCLIDGCIFTNISEPQINWGNGSNLTVQFCQAINSRGEGDFIRPRGVGHNILQNYVYHMQTDGAGHPDFIQLDDQSSAEIWLRDINVIGNWVEGYEDPTISTDCALGQIESGHFADPRYTNMLIANNVFKYVRGTWSTSSDGMKFFNNLFYRTARQNGFVTGGGGSRGSSYDMQFNNNIFYQGYWTNSADEAKGWYYNGLADGQGSESNTTVSADYNFVCRTNNTAAQAAPPDDFQHWAITGQESHGINGGDPLFTDEANGDYRLATNSPCIGTGTDLSAYFTTDFFGNTRSTWDLGPFAITGPAPSAPGVPRHRARGNAKLVGRIIYR